MKTKPRLRLFRFNLVEIIIALSVVIIGIISIMGIFPVGFNASRDAIADSYSGDAADHMLHVITALLKDDWSVITNDDIPNAPPDVSDGSGDISGWTLISGTDNLYWKNYPPASGEKVYRIRQATTTTGLGAVVDFDAMIRVWKSPTDAWEYNSVDGWVKHADTTFKKRVQLNIEISYPAAVTFSGREKTYFVMEVSKDQ